MSKSKNHTIFIYLFKQSKVKKKTDYILQDGIAYKATTNSFQRSLYVFLIF
jgi:hypothetical protein